MGRTPRAFQETAYIFGFACMAASGFGQCTSYVPDPSASPFPYTVTQKFAITYTNTSSGQSGPLSPVTTYQYPVPNPYDLASFVGLDSAKIFATCNGAFVSQSATLDPPFNPP